MLLLPSPGSTLVLDASREDDARSEPNLGGFAKWYRNRLHLDLGGQLFHKVPTSHSTRNTDQTGARARARCVARSDSQSVLFHGGSRAQLSVRQANVSLSRHCLKILYYTGRARARAAPGAALVWKNGRDHARRGPSEDA